MRLPALWTFADIMHPVYTRPPEATKWVFGDKRFKQAEYEHEEEVADVGDFPVTEPLRAEMAPSTAVYQTPGTHYTVMSVRMRSPRFAGLVDLSGIRDIARRMWQLLKALSRGPLKSDDLRDMNHPYGYGTPGKSYRTAWEQLRHPRKLPTQPKRHYRSVRGSVANRDIVNLASGQFEGAWRWSVLPFHGGATVNLWNVARSPDRGAPYPWFLFHGTRYMQAHGPWGKVLEIMQPMLMREWRSQTRKAQARVARELAARVQRGGRVWNSLSPTSLRR